MSIVGIGSDIVQVSRIETLVARYGRRFLQRVFSETETAYAFAKARPAIHLAARFAAKEAFVKALGLGLREGLSWCDVEVINNNLGQPQLKLHNRAHRVCYEKNQAVSWLSLSHEQDFALAFVVLETTVTVP
ncbi:MAG: holo-ACP synthase [Deltaproteobacteria bacterium]|nr:holo-ACP synthase [Deltaproteobacteria bacterium]